MWPNCWVSFVLHARSHAQGCGTPSGMLSPRKGDSRLGGTVERGTGRRERLPHTGQAKAPVPPLFGPTRCGRAPPRKAHALVEGKNGASFANSLARVISIRKGDSRLGGTVESGTGRRERLPHVWTGESACPTFVWPYAWLGLYPSALRFPWIVHDTN